MTEDTHLMYDKPLPTIDSLTRGYWENAKFHRLSVQECSACGSLHFPAGPVCPNCLSDDQDWTIVSGRGTLISWCRFHRAYWSGFQRDIPYDVCVVKLEEGPLIVSNVKPEHVPLLKMGMPMRACFDDVTDEVSLVRFAPQ